VPTSAPSGSSIAGNLVTDGSGNSTIYIGAGATASTATVGDVLAAIDLASGVAYNNAGTITANTSQTLSNITAGAIYAENLDRCRSERDPARPTSSRLSGCRPRSVRPDTVSAARTTSSATLEPDHGRLDLR